MGKFGFFRLAQRANSLQGFVHTSVADDEYKGYHLPQGTFFFGNAWSVLQINCDFFLTYH
jgi:hypothetical protein